MKKFIYSMALIVMATTAQGSDNIATPVGIAITIVAAVK